MSTADTLLANARSTIEQADKEIIDSLVDYRPNSANLSQNAAKFLTDRVAKTLRDCPQEVIIAVLERINLSDRETGKEEENLVNLADALARRFDAAVNVALAKEQQGRETSYDEKQHNGRLQDNEGTADAMRANPGMVRDIFEFAIMANFVKYQDEYLQRRRGPISKVAVRLEAA